MQSRVIVFLAVLFAGCLGRQNMGVEQSSLNGVAKIKFRMNCNRQDELNEDVDLSRGTQLTKEYQDALNALAAIRKGPSTAAPDTLKPKHIITCYDHSGKVILTFWVDSFFTGCITAEGETNENRAWHDFDNNATIALNSFYEQVKNRSPTK
jgi:hypothetical protein